MKKKIFYLLLVFVLIFSFNNNAKADELNCEYRFDNKTLVLIKKQPNKKAKYYWYIAPNEKENLTLPYDEVDMWVKFGWRPGTYFKLGSNGGISKKENTCPKYASLIKRSSGGKNTVIFNNDKVKKCLDNQVCDVTRVTPEETSTAPDNSNKKTNVDGEDENELKEKLSKNSCDKIDLKNTWLSPSTVDNHTHSCLYSYSSGNSCALAQIDYSYDAGLVGNSSYEMFPKPGYIAYDISFSDITISGIRNLSPNLSCPANIYFKETPRPSGGVGAGVYKGSFSLVKGGEQEFKLERYQYKDADGNETDDPSKVVSSKPGSLLKSNSSGEITCDDIVGSGEGSLQELLKNGLLIARILVPIAVIALSAADISTAIFGEEDKMKKAQAKFIKRLIIAVAFFLTPSLLKLILTLANSIWPTISSDFCGIL